MATDNLKWMHWAEDEVSPFLSGAAMNTAVVDFEVDDLAAAFAFLDYAEKQCKKRKELLRERLLTEALDHGSQTEKGGSILFTDGAKVIREKRIAKLPDEAGIKALIREKGLDTRIVFSVVEKVVLDPSKLESAVDTGKLDEEDIAALRKVSYALKVAPSMELERTLLGSREPGLVEDAPKKKAAPKKKKKRRTVAARKGA